MTTPTPPSTPPAAYLTGIPDTHWDAAAFDAALLWLARLAADSPPPERVTFGHPIEQDDDTTTLRVMQPGPTDDVLVTLAWAPGSPLAAALARFAPDMSAHPSNQPTEADSGQAEDAIASAVRDAVSKHGLVTGGMGAVSLMTPEGRQQLVLFEIPGTDAVQAAGYAQAVAMVASEQLGATLYNHHAPDCDCFEADDGGDQ